MARYQIIFSYDGTGFVGSQRQAGSRTVQKELESALRSVGWTGRSILLAGRTDAGVHASGQVAAADLAWAHSPADLLRALNANLPEDMAVSAARIVPDSFHPRFDATSRCYRYRVYAAPERNPLRDRFAWRVWPMPETGALQSAAQELIGRHDFAAFGSALRAGGSTLRSVSSSSWTANDDEWTFEVRADAFLYRMVRRMTYVQIAVGQGRLSAEAIRSALASQGRLPAGLAPACGLTLVEVTYPPLDDLT